MTKPQKQGLVLVSAGCALVLLLLVFALKIRAVDAVHDFIGSYYASHCLLHQEDPYNQDKVLARFRAEGGVHPIANQNTRKIISRYLYPPSVFAVMVPMSLLPWGAAHVIWAFGSLCSLILAGYLVWELCARDAPVLGGALIGYVVGSSYVLVVLANPSELAIGLCVTAVWCFLRERCVPAGIVCLAASLAMKPQIAGLVWLYFLLAGGLFRKRALQALLLTCVLCLPFVLWVWDVAPNWFGELGANVQAFSVPGGATDPGPASRTANDLVNLQVVASRIWDRAGLYNVATYLVLAPMLAAWAALTVRSRGSQGAMLYGLAAIAPLSMLPLYHHVYDAKLLLLTLPALALLWVRRDGVAWTALLVTGAALLLTGDVSHQMLMAFAGKLHRVPVESAARLNDVAVCAAPSTLLLTAVFYLWVFWRAGRAGSV